jgi:hypothetical protein
MYLLMPVNWKDIKYLKTGTENQQFAWHLLSEYKIMAHLKDFDPILAGTIPLSIDIEESDLDIVCYSPDFICFTNVLKRAFTHFEGFAIKQKQLHNTESLICRFNIENKLVEIVGQPIHSELQLAYRHMLIELEILMHFGPEFKESIIKLKKSGTKTEPAFAKLLGLKGDPYQALLDYKLT